MEIRDVIELGSLLVAVLAVAITIIKMWFAFRTKLEEHKTYVLVLLKEFDVKLTNMKTEHEETCKRHETEISEVTETMNRRMDQFHQENREDHHQIFEQLKNLSVMMAEVKTSLTHKTTKR